MQGHRFIESMILRNFLSYGPKGVTVDLQPLNVLIGPNGSGKSNFIEAIGFLKAAPTDLPGFFREGGGVQEWLWKRGAVAPVAEVTANVFPPTSSNRLRYRMEFTSVAHRFEIKKEMIEARRGARINTPPAPNNQFYHFEEGLRPVFRIGGMKSVLGFPENREVIVANQNLINYSQSILAQRRDPLQYPEITFLAEQFGKIALYRDWNFGRHQAPRTPEPVEQLETFLREDVRNLGLVLNSLQLQDDAKQRILTYLKRFNERIADYVLKIEGGTLRLYLKEQNGSDVAIPSSRLSDGTLRFLCLLAILCHPEPPPLVCIEEPEVGMHPDVMTLIAELLIEASERTQLVVTTHSDVLVSALSRLPSAVMVCEAGPEGSQIRRLNEKKLKLWLEKYTLGELWLSGEIGGTR